MAKTIRYQKTVKMEPRDGQKYSTTYYKQTLQQRQELVNHIQACVKEMVQYLDQNPQDLDWAMNTGLKGFPKTTGGKRTMWEIMADIAGEAQGRTRQNLPKDFASAPIERWNKLFAGTEYEFIMTQTFSAPANNFHNIMKIANEQLD